MNISLAGFSFYNLLKENKMDIFHYLETVKYRYHLNTVDLWNGFFSTQEDTLRILSDETYIENIKDAIEERDLTVVNFAIDGAHIWDPDPAIREKLHENALKHLEAAKLLGAKTVRIDTGGYESLQINEEQFDLIVKRYQEYCEVVEEYGIYIGPENHMGPSLVPKTMLDIAKAVDRPNYGILLHASRWKGEDQSHGNSMLASYAYHVHFDPKRTDLNHMENEIKPLMDAGYRGYWAIEYNPVENHYLEIEWALASLKKSLIKVYTIEKG
ncbi:sugar phosphate isomerase/epimerase family protein [Bacillus sp. SD088]|uniref:sugar phosphate isomerase/epimerase family protein n=1 Tax=Bacillus sp. SD088 TaxID=2782012 RepID=UPI001A959662|nr:TIM barrel protein [Bacillus sp. SD088]MBO0992121.1 sugar phosphate isomerase/epimerase [Bacillus sp. SD088]